MENQVKSRQEAVDSILQYPSNSPYSLPLLPPVTPLLSPSPNRCLNDVSAISKANLENLSTKELQTAAEPLIPQLLLTSVSTDDRDVEMTDRRKSDGDLGDAIPSKRRRRGDPPEPTLPLTQAQPPNPPRQPLAQVTKALMDQLDTLS